MVEQALAQVRIVLVEPAGPLNIGAIARIMKNMGLQTLVLVNPQCDHLGRDARQMAVHASTLLEQAQCVTTVSAALGGCQQAIATTARDRHFHLDAQPPRQILPRLLQGPSALIFGPEERGLSNAELSHAHYVLRIPSSPAYPVLNLAQAVTICCYELHQLAIAKSGSIAPRSADLAPVSSGVEAATLEQLEAYYQQLEALLLEIGYLYPHTAAARMLKVRRLFNRSQLSGPEVAMLRGILSQVKWKIAIKS